MAAAPLWRRWRCFSGACSPPPHVNTTNPHPLLLSRNRAPRSESSDRPPAFPHLCQTPKHPPATPCLLFGHRRSHEPPVIWFIRRSVPSINRPPLWWRRKMVFQTRERETENQRERPRKKEKRREPVVGNSDRQSVHFFRWSVILTGGPCLDSGGPCYYPTRFQR
ncbi:hypothetical protein Hdeb2414_s0020g00553811 [Helianthus debilis subsp. tardiflorus]